MYRRHDIDALRVLAFGILILYHCGMLFVPNWGWHIKSSYQLDGLDTLMQFFNAWRMPLLFLISGTAIALANPQHRLSEFVKSRVYRLLFPLIVAMIFTVPFQAYVQAVSNGSVQAGLVDFFIQYFTFQPWPEGAFDGSDVGFTWNHLWYLPYLFLYTMLLSSVLLLKNKFNQHWAKVSKVQLAILTLVAFLFIIALKTWVRPNFPETHALVDDLYAHPYYLTFFVFGYLLGRPAAKNVWDSLANNKTELLLCALALFFITQLLKPGASGTTSFTEQLLKNALHTAYTFSMLGAILAFGFKYLNKKDSFLAPYSQAIFPWYIIHQTLIVILAYWFTPLKLGGLTEATIIIFGTFAGCTFLYKYVILPLPFLHNAFGIFAKK